MNILLPSNYQEWKEKAIIVDNTKQQFDHIKQEYRGPDRYIPKLTPKLYIPPQKCEPTPIADHYDATGRVFRGQGQPMDVILNQYQKNRACFKCGVVRHFTRDCSLGQLAIQRIIAALDEEDRMKLFEELRMTTEMSEEIH